MKIFVETKRFFLRELIEADVEGMFALDADPEVHRYLGNNPVQTRDECLEDIRHVRQQYLDNGIGRWAIIDKTTGDFVGWTGLKFEQTPVNNRQGYYDLGYRLRRNYWGKGIATETAIASLQYGFEKMQLPEICAAAHLDNHASNAVLRKVGLTFVETFAFEDMLCNWYVLQRSDWLSKRVDDGG